MAAGLCAMAETLTYNEPLVVTIDGESTDSIPSTVVVEDKGAVIDFTLTNFKLISQDEEMGELVIPVGNIFLADIPCTVGEGTRTFEFTGDILIQPGNEEGLTEEDWLGPQLMEVPLVMHGSMSKEHLYVEIDIDFQMLGQIIHVELGTIQNVQTVGITATSTVPVASEASYDLQGRIANALRGIRIQSGKKVYK